MTTKENFHVFEILLGLSLILVSCSKKQPCYFMKMLDYTTTDSSDYLFNMELFENQTISAVTRVLKDIPLPVWHIKIVQHTKEEKSKGLGLVQQGPKVLYNATYKTCDFWKYVQRVPVFSNVAELVLSKDTTNMSLSCPLLVGTYVMRNIKVPPDTGFLKFMYWPNTFYTLFGTVYSQRSDKSFVKKCSYTINGTVLKTC